MIMAKLERITVTMPEEMAAKMRAAVESGEYATTSEIVREALRDWDEYQERRHAKLATLRTMIAEGEKGPFRDGEEVMSELIEKYRTLAEKERKKAA
jgi:antitoxin ParD1/3/4